MTKFLEYTFNAMLARVSPGDEASDAGHRDGSRNYPDNISNQDAPYLEVLRGRAQTELDDITSWMRDNEADFYNQAQSVCVEPELPQQVCNNISQTRVEEIEEQVAAGGPIIKAARSVALDAVRSLDFAHHRAGTERSSEPPQTGSYFLSFAAFFVFLEGWLAYALLREALVPITALFSGFLLAIVVFGLGATTGYFSLRPLDRNLRHSRKRWLKIVVGGGLCLATATGLTLVASAWRSALIAGLSGSSADIWSILSSDWTALAHWETLALCSLSAVAFTAAFYETRHFFLYHERELREQELAWRKAEAKLRSIFESFVGKVAEIATAGRAEITRFVRSKVEKVHSIDRRGHALKGQIMQANEWMSLVPQVFKAAYTQYRSANESARTESAPVWPQIAIEPRSFPIPAGIDHIVERAAETSEQWNRAAKTESRIVTDAELGAIAQFEAIADLAPRSEQSLVTPTAALPWRAAA